MSQQVLNLDDTLPVYNPLACDGGRCDTGCGAQALYYLDCSDGNGKHLPNRFLCGNCIRRETNQLINLGVRIRTFTIPKGDSHDQGGV